MAMLGVILTSAMLSSNCLAIDDLDISSLELKYDRHKKTATFSGNVVLCFNNIKLLSQKIIFHFHDDNGKKIEKVHIPKKLKAIKSEKESEDIILSDSATYYLKEETLHLKGNVTIQNKKDVIITDEMVYHGKLKKIAKNEP